MISKIIKFLTSCMRPRENVSSLHNFRMFSDQEQGHSSNIIKNFSGENLDCNEIELIEEKNQKNYSDLKQDYSPNIVQNISQESLDSINFGLTEEEKQEIYAELELLIYNTVQPIDFNLELRSGVICERGVYTGQYLNNQKSGIGKFILENGDFYHGYWQNDKPNGLGRLFLGSQHHYEGNFLDGEFHGHGTYSMRLYKYKGDWVYGRREGFGYEKYIENDSKCLDCARKLIYYGEFINDEKNGRGTLTLMKDRNSYVIFEGSFTMGKMEKVNFDILSRRIKGTVLDDCKKLIAVSLPKEQIDIEFNCLHESNQIMARLCINGELIVNSLLEGNHSFFLLNDSNNSSLDRD